MSAPFRLDALNELHDRAAFACGEEALDRYFQKYVTQDICRNIANCFVAIEAGRECLAAYYTLSASSIPTPELPPELIRKLPRYPTIPAVRIGRLAVDQRFCGKGLGAAMLTDAAFRTLGAAPAAFALVVDAKNDQAVAFYQHHGFLSFSSRPRTLFLPLATAARVLFPKGQK